MRFQSWKFRLFAVAVLAVLSLGGGHASAQSISRDSAPVLVNVGGGGSETPTVTVTPTATATATTTATATVPAVTDLPETGGSNHSSSTIWVFSSMLFAGALLICCALVSTRTDYDRQL